MKKIIKVLLIVTLLIVMVGCGEKVKKFSESFYQTFDTSISYLSYTKTKEDFDKEYKTVKDEFTRLHKLYDNFNTYDGIINVKKLNELAGQGPQKVERDLFDIIKYSKDMYDKTNGKLNIAMGNVIKLWNDARNYNIEPSLDIKVSHAEIPEEDRVIPKKEDLEACKAHMNIEDIVLDEANMTIELKDPDMLIDLGAIGKGYATELVAKKLKGMGVKYASINAGGNVRAIGTPGPDRKKWGIGIQKPEIGNGDYLEVLFIGETSIVTSGDYQRYFEKDGVRYHHIIDPETLMPAGEFNSVSIITEDSGLADYLSTTMFLASKEEALEILKNFEDVGIIWYSKAEGLSSTDNIKQYMKSEGAKDDNKK